MATERTESQATATGTPRTRQVQTSEGIVFIPNRTFQMILGSTAGNDGKQVNQALCTNSSDCTGTVNSISCVNSGKCE